MCSATTFEFLQDTVRKFVGEDRLFTAFDVTLSAKKYAKEKNCTIDERHRDLKNDVHNLVEQYVQNGIYQKELWDVGAPTRAFLYFPNGGNPKAYCPIDRPNTKAATVAQSSAQADPNDGDCVDIGRKPDSRGCVTVPCYMLRVVGFLHKDTAYVYANQNNVSISKVDKGNSVATYTVDYHNNVRISQQTLAKANIAGKTYDFKVENNEVIVEEH